MSQMQVLAPGGRRDWILFWLRIKAWLILMNGEDVIRHVINGMGEVYRLPRSLSELVLI